MTVSTDAYGALTGLELVDGWRLGAIKIPDAAATGGTFSVQFEVERADGRVAFAKVLDLVDASQPPDVAKKLELATKAFNYEADLVRICAEFGARRVVYALASGELSDPRVPLNLVNYIVFEQADTDVRSYLDHGYAQGYAARFRALRHVALGLRELHDLSIAHQDLKPSNVLIFGCATGSSHEGKVADLGKASRAGSEAVHDADDVAGTYPYTPPELLYGQVPTDFYERRQACDLYQMGALMVFVLASMVLNRDWNKRIGPQLNWRRWGGSYAEVYPSVFAAMADSFSKVEASLPIEIREDVGALVRDLCNPDPEMRGSRLRGASKSRKIILSRLITRLDVLEHKARRFSLEVA